MTKRETVDLALIEKIAGLNRESVPERLLHAKGTGAYGFFRAYMPMSDFTCANFLQDPEEKTPVFVRFSNMVGSRGSADTLRAPRGFDVKFYTNEGNYDLISSSLPVRFIRDGRKLPDLIRSLKPSGDSNIGDPQRFWAYMTKLPEAMHMITWLFSDCGTMKSYRTMEGYSGNTYLWICPQGRRYFVRYHWKPMLERKDITRQEAEFLAGFDPDIAGRELFDSLASGETTEFELCVQLVQEGERYRYGFDLLDATKIWSPEQIPYVRAGKLTLDRSPENYYREVERAAFSPSNLVPGIRLSEDPLLPAMVFTYNDANRQRLGIEYEHFSINQVQPHALLRLDMDESKDTEQNLHGDEDGKINCSVDIEKIKNRKPDDFIQAGDHFRRMTKREQEHLIGNLADHMMFIDTKLQKAAIGNFKKADEEFGRRLERSLDF